MELILIQLLVEDEIRHSIEDSSQNDRFEKY